MAMTLKMEINPIACTAHQLCADLLPELIELDEWGYPIIPDKIPVHLEGHARRAVSACPTLALRLSRVKAHQQARRAS
jgi:ferredoxin